MDRLPAELLTLVAEQCDHASQKHLRLTNKDLRHAATPFVFEHFYMGLFIHCLNKFTALASSPLARYVKKLTFMADIIPGGPHRSAPWIRTSSLSQANRARWEASNDEKLVRDEVIARLGPVCDRHHRRVTRDEVLDNAFERLLVLMHEQNSWRQDVHGKAFQEAFLKLPSLTHASVKSAMSFDRHCNGWPVWKRIVRSVYVGPDQWRKRYKTSNRPGEIAEGQATVCLLEAVGRRNLSGISVHIKPIISLDLHTAFEGSCFENIMCMDTRGIVEPQRPQTQPTALELEVEALPLDSEEHTAKRKELTQSQDHEWLEILRAPDDLTINRPEQSGLGLEYPCKELHRFLQGARKLKRLDLEFSFGMSLDSVLDSEEIILPWERYRLYEIPEHAFPIYLFGSTETIWPDIEHLSLSINIPTSALLDFLQAHAATLRSLELKRMLVQDVPTLLAEIPKTLRLEHAKMRYLWHDDLHSKSDRVRQSYCAFDPEKDDEVYLKLWEMWLMGDASDMPELRGWNADGTLHTMR